MKKHQLNINFSAEIIVDNFAGGGGASVGIEMALGRSPDVAVNHDPEAVAMHAENHPETRHFCEDVFKVDPLVATLGRPVGLAWFSPDCKHHSKARGGKPREKRIRGLAWVAVKWAAKVRPRVIILENVEEFQDLGPLVDGRPCPRRKGRTFQNFLARFRNLGYSVEYRELRACDYRAPTECIGTTGIFLDPPYGTDADRAANIYREDSLAVAEEVRQWAVENGDNPALRIALCGYEGEHDMPKSWRVHAWKANGGHANSGAGKGRANAARERVWFSPACLDPEPELFPGGLSAADLVISNPPFSSHE